jgi:hypothetical protein
MPEVPSIGAQDTACLRSTTGPSRGKGGAQVDNSSAAGLNDRFTPAPGGAFALAQTGAVSLPAQPSLQALPPPSVDRAVLYEHNSDGGYTATSKIPCEKPEEIVHTGRAGGATAYIAVADDLHRLIGISAEGTVQFQIEMSGRNRYSSLHYSEKEHALFVRTTTGIIRCNPDSGAIEAQKDLDFWGSFNCTDFNDDGDVMTSSDQKLLVLDGMLNEKKSTDLGIRPNHVRSLPGGYTFCLADNCPAQAILLAKNGTKLIEEHKGGLYGNAVRDDGKAYFIDTVCEYGRSTARRIVCFDPSTGKAESFKTTKDCEALQPLKDGSLMVFDDRLAKPRLINYSGDGKVQWNTTFDSNGYLRQFHLNKDETKAFVVFDRDSKQERCLFEIDLSVKPDFMGKVTGSLLSKGAARVPKLLYTEHSNHRGMTPAVLDDGRIVICEEKGIHLLAPDGREIRQYGTSTELLRDLNGAPCSTKPCYCGTGSDFKKDEKVENVLVSAITSMRSSNAGMYQPPSIHKDMGGFTYNPNDCTLNWKSSLDEQSALKAMGICDENEFASMLEKQLVDPSMYGMLLKNTDGQLLAEMPLGDGITPQKGSVKIERNSLTVEIPGRDIQKFIVGEPSHIITALPVSTGKKDFIFAGTDDGQVLWYDLQKNRLHQAYDAGEAVAKITLSGTQINAITAGGRVLSISPATTEGELLATAVKAGTSADSGDGATEAVIKEDDFIVIDGLKLERKQMGHLGKITRKS